MPSLQVGGGFALFIPIILISVIVLIPAAHILHRTGHSRWWCLLMIVPLLNVIGLWVLAYVRWPAVDKKVQTVPTIDAGTF
jgi:uncharacterized membrane protein YhaH (DUF805 family)